MTTHTHSLGSLAPHGLSFLWLEITSKCNLECSHCYADSGPQQTLYGQMNLRAWETVIEDSSGLGCRQIQFIGGEPTLHPDLPRLIELAAARGFTFIEVFTNSSIIPDRLLQIFTTHHVRVATSFYSIDPQTHDLITGRVGSFGRTVKSIKRMLSQGILVRAGIIETEINRGHADDAFRFLNELGVTDIKVDFQRAVGRGVQICSPEPMAQLCGECSKGKLCVTASGKVYPCVFSRFVEVGNIEDGIQRIVDGDRLITFRVNLARYRNTKAFPNAALAGGSEVIAEICQPARCNPTTCSPCGPDSFIRKCTPEGLTECMPAARCIPAERPSCAPNACVPETTCGPDR